MLKTLALLIAVVTVSHVGHAQGLKKPLLVTSIPGIGAAWPGECGGSVVDNRSVLSRANNYHAVTLTSGSPNWTVAINYSDTSCAGPWTTFGSASQINQSSNPAVAYGNGYHPFIQIAITGNAIVTYVGQNQLPLSTAVGSVSFPIAVPQGGTGLTTLAPHSVVLGNGTSTPSLAAPGPVGGVLTSNGGSSDPSFKAGPSSLNPDDFDFPAQTPGGSLIQFGANQTITLAPCPLGIVTSGASATAFYISGGTGTAEWLRPTSGTCTSGASSGTIVVTPQQAHSGAWTISSATAGIDLACSSSSLGAYVVVPPGDYNIYGTIKPAKGCTIDGLGTPSATGPWGAVNLHMQTNAVPMFDLVNAATTTKNLQLSFGTFPAYTVGGVVASSGSICIHSESNESTGNSPLISNIICNNFYNNLLADGSGSVRVEGFTSLAAVGGGIITSGLGSGYMKSILVQSSGGNGITLNGPQAALQWHAINTFNNGGWGIQTKDQAAFQMDNIDSEGDYLGEISITTPPSNSWSMQNLILQSCGQTSSQGTNTTAPCLKVNSGNALGILANVNVGNSQGNGMMLDGSNTLVIGAHISSAGASNTANNTNCVEVSGALVTLIGAVCISGPAYWTNTFNGSTTKVLGGSFINQSASVPAVTIGASAGAIQFCNNYVQNAGGAAALAYTAGATGIECTNTINGPITGTLGYDGLTQKTLPFAPIPNATALTVTSNAIAPTLPLHTLGAGLVKTITPPNVAVSGCFDLIATAAFTTDVTSNIVTPAITATVGKLYHACYNAATTLWSLTN